MWPFNYKSKLVVAPSLKFNPYFICPLSLKGSSRVLQKKKQHLNLSFVSENSDLMQKVDKLGVQGFLCFILFYLKAVNRNI